MKVPAEWLEAVDLARGGETRSAFVRRLVAGAVGMQDPVAAVAGRVEAEQAVRAVGSSSGPAAPVTSAREAAGLPPRVRTSPALERFGGS